MILEVTGKQKVEKPIFGGKEYKAQEKSVLGIVLGGMLSSVKA